MSFKARFLFLPLLLLPGLAAANPARPLALVYRGPGTCWKGCAEAAAAVATHAGYDVSYVGPEETNEALFFAAKLWIQPGGRAIDQARAMTPELKNRVRDFVERGGGYVGFCAGAFMASRQFGWEEKNGARVQVDGLGLLPLKSRFYYPETQLARVLPIRLEDGRREYFYWELGPFIDARQEAPGVEFLGFYEDQGPDYAAAARANYGRGRVIVSAFHPEAPALWRYLFGLHDPDGLDFGYAHRMLRWAANARE